MLNTLRSAWIWFSIALLVLLWMPVMAVTRLFDRDPVHYATGRMFRRLGAAMTRVNPAWKIRIEGTYPADPRNPYVVVSNHQSNADIPLVSRLPWEMKWVGKAELFRLPLVGWFMRVSDDIPVDRDSQRSRATVLIRAMEVLRQHCSVMFFPEGTRSRDGLLLPFNDGAFRLAVKAQVPILPLALDGTTDALPKGGWRFGPPSDIRLAVLEPIPTEGLTVADVPALRDRVVALIAEQLAAWRGVPVAAVLAGSDAGSMPTVSAASSDAARRG
ncbi:MAG: 1-acyl-sn-glycerol-3-phosphate acyltransferase [Bacteroidetes bacterium]|nr:1-acyl-sn-glycerol-3-phosphate acyltransferase [Bacteroidota bacterium]